MNTFAWSVALCNADLGRLDSFFETVSRAPGAAAIHVDLGDGRFAPEFGGGTVLTAAAGIATLPLDVHAQVRDADAAIGALLKLECASITLPIETLTHAHRALAAIRAAGRQPGLALAPATPLTSLEYLLGSVDRILLLARDPGERRAPLRPAIFERVKIMRENLDYHGRKVLIEVEGVSDARDIAALLTYGANRIVIDDADLIRRPDFIEAIADLTEEVHAQRFVT